MLRLNCQEICSCVCIVHMHVCMFVCVCVQEKGETEETGGNGGKEFEKRNAREAPIFTALGIRSNCPFPSTNKAFTFTFTFTFKLVVVELWEEVMQRR